MNAATHASPRRNSVSPTRTRRGRARRAKASALAVTERPTATNGGVRNSASSNRRAAALFSSGARFAARRHARSSARAAGPETPSAKAKASSATTLSELPKSVGSIRPSYVFGSVRVPRSVSEIAFRSDPNPPGAPRVNRRNAVRVTTSTDVTSRAVVVAAFVD